MFKGEEVPWKEVAQKFKDNAWNIVEDWLEETKLDFTSEQLYQSLTPDEIISEIPTLLGGIALVIEDPSLLGDFDLGGSMHDVAYELGKFRQQTGYQIEKVISDYCLLQKKIHHFCEDKLPLEKEGFWELQNRLSQALGKILRASIEGYHRSAAIELTELSQKDKLTGLFHLKALMRLVEAEMQRARRYHHSLALAIIDIDNFKEYNSNYGRLAGNQLLQHVARTIVQNIRMTDQPARLGKDEFAILMPETEAKRGCFAAERIRRQVRQESFRNEAFVTISTGVASYPQHASSKESLIESTLQALSIAQREGGDLTQISPQTNNDS